MGFISGGISAVGLGRDRGVRVECQSQTSMRGVPCKGCQYSVGCQPERGMESNSHKGDPAYSVQDQARGGGRIPAGWRWWPQRQFKPGCIQGDRSNNIMKYFTVREKNLKCRKPEVTLALDWN